MTKLATTEKSEKDIRLHSEFEGYGAIPSLAVRVFERIGGEDAMVEYAEENRGWFYTHFLKMRPNVAPISGIQGEVNIVINNGLSRTALDIEGEAEDVG